MNCVIIILKKNRNLWQFTYIHLGSMQLVVKLPLMIGECKKTPVHEVIHYISSIL